MPELFWLKFFIGYPEQALPCFEDAIKLLFGQTIRSSLEDRAFKSLETVDSILRSVPVFSLECNMDDDAAFASYNGIERLIKNED